MTGVALVTGAARGIGAATVAELVSQGWGVIAMDRASADSRLPYEMGTGEELAAVVALANATAGQTVAIPVVGDAALAPDVISAVGLAEQHFGGLDAFIGAAGTVGGGVPFWEMPEAQQQAVLDGNLHTVLTPARIVIPALLRRPAPRQGRFIAVASAAASRGLPMLAGYSAAKAAVVGFVRALAAELGGTGIAANTVSPGSTRTAMLDESARLYGLGSAHAFAEQQPIGRLVEPVEVARMIVWLAGSGGAAVTGTDVRIDGGLTV